MDSWQNPVWRFIPFKQAKLMKNKLEHLRLYVVSNIQFFIFHLREYFSSCFSFHEPV